MNTHRDDREETLDRLLTSLGSVKVDADFEQRILRRVEAHQAPTQAQRSPRLPWTFGLASAIAAALIGAAILLHSGRRSGPPPMTARVESRVPQTASQAIRVPGRTRIVARQKAAQLPPDRGATMLVSFPAPEAPLSEQERLLLRLVHRNNPLLLAALSPEVQALKEAEKEAEFRRFFPTPKPIDYGLEPIKTETTEKGDTK